MRVQFSVDKVPFYKHTEEFRLDKTVSMSRRDKKSGKQHAVLRSVPEGVQVQIKLDPPFSGAGPCPTTCLASPLGFEPT